MRWEYYILQLKSSNPYDISTMDALGELGYELVSVDNGVAYLKRPAENDITIYSYDTVQDGYVIYKNNVRVDPWYLVQGLNDNDK